jgi:hypothetical protein
MNCFYAIWCCLTKVFWRYAMPNAAEMTWNDIQALVAELAIQSKETDRKFQETDLWCCILTVVDSIAWEFRGQYI